MNVGKIAMSPKRKAAGLIFFSCSFFAAAYQAQAAAAAAKAGWNTFSCPLSVYVPPSILYHV
jgi:hypothetical protein